MEKFESVRILVPVYRPTLTGQECASLEQTLRVLGRYPTEVLCPEGMDVSFFEERFPGLTLRPVSDEWLGTKNGIAGYNRMMMSRSFYELFSDAEYILICHTDAWIFGDELETWCRKGYDCVAAPWIRRPIYELPLVKHYMEWRSRSAERQDRPTRQILYGRIGNGGLSLRRVEAFREACDRYAAVIDRYLSEPHHLFNEDVFWATVPQEFRYPSADEALRFAFDTHPAYCYRRCGKRLPFGCHSWTKPRMYRFWRHIIPWRSDC